MQQARPTLSRRNILITIGAALAGTIAMAGTAFRPVFTRQARRVLAATPLTRGMLSLSQAEVEEWSTQIGANFIVGGGFELRLAGIQPLQSDGARPSSLRNAVARYASSRFSPFVLDMAEALIDCWRHKRARAPSRTLWRLSADIIPACPTLWSRS